MPYYYPMMNGTDWGWGVFMMLFWLIFVALIIWLAVRLFKGYEADSKHKSPLDIAKQRYAKGEINKEQFEQLKKDLK